MFLRLQKLTAVVLHVVIVVSSASENNESAIIKETRENVKPIHLYLNLFKVKRKEHLTAVQKIILVEDVAKQAAFVKVMMETIIDTLFKSMINLDLKEYVVSQDFPEESDIKDDLSKVLENTALFTDLIVRFPKSGHIFYKKNFKKWKKILSEAIGICSGSGVFHGDYETLLHNLRQELGIGPKDENYNNPFLKEADPKDTLTSEERKRMYKAAKSKQKLNGKKAKRTGPRLTSHIEL